MSQSSVSLNQDVAIRGMYAVDRPHDTFTGANQEADDALNFGDPVYISSYDDLKPQVSKMGTTAATAPRLDGFVAYDSRMEGKILNKQSVAIVRKGFIWVAAGLFDGAIAAGVANLHYDRSAGDFLTGLSTTTGDLNFYGSIFLWSAVTAGQATTGTKLLQLEINLPGYQVVHA